VLLCHEAWVLLRGGLFFVSWRYTMTEKKPPDAPAKTPQAHPDDTLDTPTGKATKFDGRPYDTGAQDAVFGPVDDTPLRLERREGPSRQDKPFDEV
jgi:hypothetical protein